MFIAKLYKFILWIFEIMDCCIIIRGPAGVGKTTIAKSLAERLRAAYFSFDELMEANGLDVIIDDGIPPENFLEANRLLLPMVLDKELVVLDGCFYRKEQLDDMLNNVSGMRVYIFTLTAEIETCLERNRLRKNPLMDNDIRQVYDLVSKLNVGMIIDTTGKTVEQSVLEILNHMNR